MPKTLAWISGVPVPNSLTLEPTQDVPRSSVYLEGVGLGMGYLKETDPS